MNRCQTANVCPDGYPNSSITATALRPYRSYKRTARNFCSPVYFTINGFLSHQRVQHFCTTHLPRLGVVIVAAVLYELSWLYDGF